MLPYPLARHGRGVVSACALALLSFPASAVVVDGDLADLQLAIANEPLAPGNTATGTESGNDAESNGFDIVNGYAWYNVATDTFYIGMNFFGDVGTAGGSEGGIIDAGCNYANPGHHLDGVASVFDGCETYGFSINVNNDASVEYDLRVLGDSVADSGEGSEGLTVLTDNSGLGLGLGAADWAVSETANGVEFSLTGLRPLLEPFSLSNPRDVRIGLFSGTVNNYGPEDSMYIDMQVVPVPAAVWLLGSGLAGLLGFSARKRRHQP